MALGRKCSFLFETLAVLLGIASLTPPIAWSQPEPQGISAEKPASAALQRLSSLLASGIFSVNDLDQIWANRALLHGSLGEFTRASPEIHDSFSVLFRVSQLCAYTGQYVLQKSSPARRSEAFSLGYQVASRAIELEPNRVEGHYWFAVNMSGYAAEDGPLKVLSMGRRILQALDTASALLPEYYFSGPLRARGRLLFKMPGFPFSFGDKEKGLGDLRKAVEKNPEVRLNQLFLAEALAELGEPSQAREALVRARGATDLMGVAEEAKVSRSISELERNL